MKNILETARKELELCKRTKRSITFVGHSNLSLIEDLIEEVDRQQKKIKDMEVVIDDLKKNINNLIDNFKTAVLSSEEAL